MQGICRSPRCECSVTLHSSAIFLLTSIGTRTCRSHLSTRERKSPRWLSSSSSWPRSWRLILHSWHACPSRPIMHDFTVCIHGCKHAYFPRKLPDFPSPSTSCRQRKLRAPRTRRVLPLLRALQGKRTRFLSRQGKRPRFLSRRKPAKRRQPGAKATTGKSTTSTRSGLSSGPGWSIQPIYL